jgi:hypothetical protein
MNGQTADFLAVLARNRAYTSPVQQSWLAALAAGGITIARLLVTNSVAIVLVSISGVVVWHSIRTFPRSQRSWCMAALLWTLAVVAGAMPGGRSYAHYYHFLWAPLSVLGTLWLAGRWSGRLAKGVQRRIVVGVAVGSLALAALHEAYSAARNVRDYWAGTHPRAVVDDAAGWLAAGTREETPVVVHVWGDWAELYWRVPRRSPSFSMPHVLPPILFNDWIQATLAEPPEVICWDGTSWEPIVGAADPALVERWTSLMKQQYVEAGRVGSLLILRRKPASGLPDNA